MRSSMPRLAALLIATLCVSACATAASDRSACPPVVEYDRATLERAADELDRLPAGSAVERLLADYAMTRDQLRACR